MKISKLKTLKSRAVISSKRSNRCLLYLLGGALLVAESHASTVSWNSTSDGGWGTSSNWTSDAGAIVPGGNFPTSIDSVVLGASGFAGTTAGTRTITVGSTYTLAGLTFSSSANNQNYVLSGAGKLILDSGVAGVASTINIGSNTTTNFQIGTEMEIHGTVNLITATTGNARVPAISGNIHGNGTDPITMKVSGGYNNGAWFLALSGHNEFKGGEVQLAGNTGLRIGTTDALKGATLRLNGEDSSNGKIIQFSTPTANNQTFTYDLKQMIVDTNGAIDVSGGFAYTGDTQNWVSTSISANKTLKISNGNNSTFKISGAGKMVSLGDNANLLVAHGRDNRSLNVVIDGGALLEGNGTVTTSLTKAAGKTTSLEFSVGNGGIIDPGVGAGNTGVLHFADTSTGGIANVRMDAGSLLRLQLNGLVAGEGFDQLSVDSGTFNLITTGLGVSLDLDLGYDYKTTDNLTLVKVGSSASLVGTFYGLSEGATVDLGMYKGSEATAKISYQGGAGKDVVLYDFAVVPEPSSLLLTSLGGIGALLLLKQKKRQAR